MNKKFEKIESIYWEISKVIGVLFTIVNYKIWTDSLYVVKAIVLIIGISAIAFVCINLFDIFVGIMLRIGMNFKRKIKNRKVLKRFYGAK